jgi:hypothetical protein
LAQTVSKQRENTTLPSLSLSVLYVAGSILSVDDEQWSRLSKYGSNKGLLEAIYSVDPASGSYLFCGSSFWKLFILWIQLLEAIYSVDPASGSYLFCGSSFWKLFILWA